MKQKTISGHYDTAYNIAHNNRTFIPRNVDERRLGWNYYCVAAGQAAYIDPTVPSHISEFWERYKELNDLYWSNRSIAQTLAFERYQAHLKYMRRYCYPMYFIPHNPVEALVTLLLLPLLIPCGIYLNHQQKLAKAEWEQYKEERWLRDMTYKAARVSLRNALYEQDIKTGSAYLHTLDSTINTLGIYAQNQASFDYTSCPARPSRFATLEEIYDRFYEPSFQVFQAKQRPCRRYNGTYLEQIREGQHREAKEKQQSKNSRSHKTAEAIEIVFTIGDMDNTGYAQSPMDAQCSAELLGDFCDRLMNQPNLCCITTEELNDPSWQPPFRNGLIVLNLTVHADEATPGVHFTCIPYSRDCKRGPKVQASMGKAMTGMGYPSTWKYVCDEYGNFVPKKNQKGEVIYNKDGTVRYQQKPDKQGIIDWIEEQKRWIQIEMKKRYDWEREYKGSHPRGHLTTPDYQAARAKERQEEYNNLLSTSLQEYEERVYELSVQLDKQIIEQWKNATNNDIIEQYLAVCPNSEYDAIVQTASTFLDQLAENEHHRVRQDLLTQIRQADEKRQKGIISKNKTVAEKCTDFSSSKGL